MSPKLRHFNPDQAQEIRDEIAYFMRPYRIRFWGVIAAMIIAVPAGLYAYATTQATVTRQVCHNQAALHNLIVLATVPQPGQTVAQRQAEAKFRLNALHLVDEGNACPPPPPLIQITR